ncbi:MAG TPA: N-succinylarginine dihydrolase [Casimicrobiaceae bacterium]|jgi:succinylarginine dihydrolase
MVEINFDGIPGPTHNYAGLARGNLAAEKYARTVANPREAALQGLGKMRALAARGIPQAVLPPHERPYIPGLRALGFSGSDGAIVTRAAREAPQLLAACSSAAAMWAANAATVSPSADTIDRRVHFTPANLIANFHRSLEADTTTRILRTIFANEERFVVHSPLPAATQFGDEGAANHTRLGGAGETAGAEMFVYGRSAFAATSAPQRYPARQTREASEAIARRHALDPAMVLLVQQSPGAIDAGVFHNDVIAVGSGNVLLCHERAFVDQRVVLEELDRMVPGFTPIVVADAEISVNDTVATYLFNSQLIARADGKFLLAAPAECNEHAGTRALLDRLISGNSPIAEVITFDLRQSMQNGGGPACLRLRVALTPAERATIRANVFIDDALVNELEAWIHRHYRDRLAPEDLADPALLDESRRALDELSTLLKLPNVYPFQR